MSVLRKTASSEFQHSHSEIFNKNVNKNELFGKKTKNQFETFKSIYVWILEMLEDADYAFPVLCSVDSHGHIKD